MLKDKRILIGVTGSIAIYKTLDLIRLFVKSGANVRVVMSEAAKKFITPLTFETLTSNKVLDESTEDWSNDNNHIAIGKWADLFIIAPVSVNTINKLSHGIADNLLTQIAIAYPRVKIIAPSANTNMIENPITIGSMKMLNLCNYKVVSPQTKELACKDVGNGAMAEPEEIFYASCKELLSDEYWLNRRVVISGGGTIERIDDVRYISNFSSGKMASSLALALYLKGAEVCLVSTRGYEKLPQGIHVIEVESSTEMYEYLVDSLRVAKKGVLTKNTLMDSSRQELIQKKPFLFMAAAVSDYILAFPQEGKLKKEMIGPSWQLELKENIDILKSLDRAGIVTIGFKAELDESVAKSNAMNMLDKKSIDAVCLNIINKDNSFGSDNNKIELLTKNSEKSFNGDKFELSLDMLEYLKELFND